jgi:hypothetical protein
MGLHLCPIEPDDWANGPNGGDEDCPKCFGSGVVMVPTSDANTPGLPIPCDCTMRSYEHFEDDVI